MTELVLLPGWGFSAQVLAPLAAAMRTPVRFVELPTSGDWRDWLDQLDQQLPAAAWLGGWSLGGMLAAALAARRGASCPGLIGLASNARFVADQAWPEAMPAADFAAFQQAYAAAPAATLKRFCALAARGRADPRGLARTLQAAQLPASASLAEGLEALAQWDNRAALGAFAGPQLHLFGRHDALLPVAAAAVLDECLPHAQITVLDAAHALPLERPQEVAGLIDAFIGGAHA